MKVDILGIGELKWTGMGEINSDDHYIHYCEQESLRINRVSLTVNKRVQNADPSCRLNWEHSTPPALHQLPFTDFYLPHFLQAFLTTEICTYSSTCALYTILPLCPAAPSPLSQFNCHFISHFCWLQPSPPSKQHPFPPPLHLAYFQSYLYLLITVSHGLALDWVYGRYLINICGMRNQK